MLFQNINKIKKSTPETLFHCTLRGTGKAIEAGWMLGSRISASQVSKMSSRGSVQQGSKPWLRIQLLHLVFPTDIHPITFAYCHLSAFLLRRTRDSGHTGWLICPQYQMYRWEEPSHTWLLSWPTQDTVFPPYAARPVLPVTEAANQWRTDLISRLVSISRALPHTGTQ